MLRFITKDLYFSWIEEFREWRREYNSASCNNLKDIQDHYIISKLSENQGLKILEIGGADCRVMSNFADRHECWNAEKFTGAGIGPKKEIKHDGVRNALVHLGEFSPELPDNYFDLVFSISVVEHILDEDVPDFFRDMARVLKPGGRAVHAIDLYVFDESEFDTSPAKYASRRLGLYHQVPEITGGVLKFVEEPEAGCEPRFKCAYASNSDREMLAWNKYAPSLSHIRSVAQSVSLAAEWVKEEAR